MPKMNIQAPSANIDSTLALFQQAANAQIAGIQQGLNFYTQSLNQAAQTFNEAYARSDAALRPLSDSATAALNQQMRMMGLDPVSSSRDSANMFSLLNGVPNSANIKDQILKAEKIQDPAQRTAAQDNIQNMLKEAQVPSSLQQQIAALGTRAATPTDPYAGLTEGQKVANNFFSSGQTGAIESKYANDLAQAKAAQTQYDQQVASLTEADKAREATNAQIASFATEYANQYSPQYDKGYTGSQVSDIITATPGYQFQLDQGTKALERQGAAKGMLGSGNTLFGLQQYGQQLAQNSYQSYMQNLSNIVAQGTGATMAIADNQIARGNAIAGVQQLQGQAQLNAQTAMGGAQSQAYYAQGQAQQAANEATAGRATSILLAAMTGKVATDTAAMGAGPGYMAQDLAQQKFRYDVQQGNQMAKGYLGAQSGSSSNSTQQQW